MVRSRTAALMYIGMGAHAVAMQRSSGEEVWRTKLESSTFVAIAIEGDRLFAGAGGELLFCLDPSSADRCRLKGGTFRIAPVRFKSALNPVPMQKKRAVALQQEWGSKPCDHPAFAKEYDLGERTGNFICTQCGKTVAFKEKAEIVGSRTAE